VLHPISVVVLLLSLTACTTNPEKCDPSKTGLISAVSGVLTNCFEDREDLQKAEYEKLKQKFLQLSELISEQDQLTEKDINELVDLRGVINSLENETSTLKLALENANSTTEEANRLLRLQDELARLQKLEETLFDNYTG